MKTAPYEEAARAAFETARGFTPVRVRRGKAFRKEAVLIGWTFQVHKPGHPSEYAWIHSDKTVTRDPRLFERDARQALIAYDGTQPRDDD